MIRSVLAACLLPLFLVAQPLPTDVQTEIRGIYGSPEGTQKAPTAWLLRDIKAGKLYIKTNTADLATGWMELGAVGSGGSGGSGDGIWTNSAGVVQLVTQTNRVNLTAGGVDGTYSSSVNGDYKLNLQTGFSGSDTLYAYIFAGNDDGYTGAGETVTGYFWNFAPNADGERAIYFGHAAYGLAGEAGYGTELTNGIAVGVFGTGNSGMSVNYGTIGYARNFFPTARTNVGLAGAANSGGNPGVYVGVYGEATDSSSTGAFMKSSAGLFNSRISTVPVIIGQTNGVDVFKVDENGNTIVSGKLDVKTNITFNGTTPVIISGGATYGNARGAGSLDVQASHLSSQVASGAGAAAVGIGNTASGAGAMAFGNGNNVSISSGTAFGQVNTVSTGSGAMAFGIGNSATGVNSLALGQSSTASAQSSVAAGTGATSDAQFTWNITGPIMNWKSEVSKGGNNSGVAGDYKFYSGVQVVLMSQEVDLKTTQDYTNSIPTGLHFYPDETGVIVTSANTVSGQPSVSFGVPGNTVKVLASTAATGLTAAFKRQRYQTLLTSEGETTLTASVTVGATATTLLGRFYWKGLLVRDQ